LVNNVNGHIRRICTRLIFVSIGVNLLATFLMKMTRITTHLQLVMNSSNMNFSLQLIYDTI